MRSLGIDVGGANTKAILLDGEKIIDYSIRYIPLWKEWERLKGFLRELAGIPNLSVIGAVMTGELSDVFKTKVIGAKKIVKEVERVFGEHCFFVTIDGRVLKSNKAKNEPRKLAAANWVASAEIVKRKFPECLFVDVGSTTTDITPIAGGKVANLGSTDFQRLKRGELVYTGILRTPTTCVLREIRGVGTASENFSIMGDVYTVLGMIGEKEYNCETPDGRGKDVESCSRRIARIFCSDLEELGKEFIVKAARALHEEQIKSIVKGIVKVARRYRIPHDSEIVISGVGRKILAEKSARKAGFKKTVDLGEIYGEGGAVMTPALGAGVLAQEATIWMP